ncbi:rubrerythrin-like domain-containing protein [Halanaeroarchaeum sp. HSR-CO]|uniref:rubrerythrin-like domain-containing protein n=1 Tax=Halanaeroarchaeum sp. HSR-CO TaxID=2866382 RepID=UPI00217DEA8C|nr:rubrerythrin-like domain-containing protein [Halanaeroarchaeum sp. HSR-CO]
MARSTLQDVLDERVTEFEASTTVGEAIETIRDSAPASENTIYYAFVTAPDGTLESVVSMRELLNADDDTEVSEVASDQVVYVETDDSIEAVGKTFGRYQFMALPVVDESGTLVGTVRAPAILEALDEESASEDLRRLVRDVEYDASKARTYECFSCGATVTAVDNPMECPECGGDLRNKGTPME